VNRAWQWRSSHGFGLEIRGVSRYFLSIPQISEDEAIAREFSYQTAEEIDLHKRVNKHVNGYLKKTWIFVRP
jgi:hypothetical protein